ncbi:maltose ABC transporter, permease [Anoxybacillus flavithermus TNO-09.006]|uniref:Maltose/maltodextrin ABC transporter permease protein MalG n=1 Tax=Anoxybacillus flavithermus TaxID=33934 RepID=A0A178T8U8_9BACL|nr:sugar ABC transporter permease [Anoxybacillus flavithermus]ELK21123.1 maltose ABC transporter, permease [Anoxybacillus flavithermus TNO-09.006]MBE2912601.1 sugar ABC transporter permease [Anoxybacillus flavithermus]MBE2940065.1 sugar ABC transporter permease [Anoxybacillus flavithermus]MBE2942528.1 sugar ABC transporter permease [Anoxybacillus flavithermus]MBE2950764.1 sugar ABC transporter permease [Anoxybacillus flavithermus]
MDMKGQKLIRLTLSYAVVLVMTIIIVYPLLWVIGSSFNPGQSLSGSKMIPDNATIAHYKKLFDTSQSDYLIWYWNSLKIATLTMIFSVILVSLTAYSFSRYRFIGRQNGLMTFLILQMIPNFAALIAIFILALLTGLVDTHLGLILVYVGGAIPMNTWLMKGYLDTIPKELDESAKIDGAGHLRIFFQIVLPLAKPIIAVVALFTFIAPFGDFILASVLLRSKEKYTLAVGLYDLVAKQFGSEFTTFAAGSVLIAVPIAILFLSFQKYFVSGLTAGGTKG